MADEYTQRQRERLEARQFATDAERDAFIAEDRRLFLQSDIQADRNAPELANIRALCALGRAASRLESAQESIGAFTPSVAEFCLAGLELSVEAEMYPERFYHSETYYSAGQIDLLSTYRDMLEQTHIPLTDFNARVFRRSMYDSLSLSAQELVEQVGTPEVTSSPGRLAALRVAGETFLAIRDPLLSDNNTYNIPLNPAYFEPGTNGERTVAGRPDYYPMYPSIAVDVGYSMTAQALLNDPALVTDPAYLAARRASAEEIAADRSLMERCYNNIMNDPEVTIGACAEIGAREAFRHLSPEEITMAITPTVNGNPALSRF